MATKKPRPYYTLAFIDGTPGCPWSIHFGDYDLESVKEELEEMRDQGFKRSELKIIKTGAAQAEIDAAIAKLNEEI